MNLRPCCCGGCRERSPPSPARSSLHQTDDLFGCQTLDLRRLEPQLCQDDCTVLTDARRGAANCGRGAVEASCGLGLADAPDVGMVELGDQLARQYLLVGDHLIAPQHWRRRHIIGIKPLQPFRSWTLLDDL